MIRKIVQHGASSLTVSLPYRWTKQNGLKKGDEINLNLMGKTILIKAGKEAEMISKTLHFTRDKPFMKRYLLNLYKQGYDEVILKFDSKLPTSKIIEKIDELLGFEIVEQDEHSCIIRNVANVKEEEFETMLKRLFIVTMGFMEDTINEMKKGKSHPSSISVEKENNKLANYCMRVLSKGYFESISRALDIATVIDKIEIIGDLLGDLRVKAKPSTKTIRLSNQILDYFKKIYISYFSSTKNLMKLKDIRTDLYKNFDNITSDQNISYQFKQVLEQLHHIELLI